MPSSIITAALPPPGKTISTLYNTPSPNLPQVFADALKVRRKVFCEEQGCSVANELDSDDGRSWHWVAYDYDDDRDPNTEKTGRQPVATIRLIPPPHDPHPNSGSAEDPHPQAKNYVKLSRLAVLPQQRNCGIARVLCEEALSWAANHPDRVSAGWDGRVLVHAQVPAEQAWARLGFTTAEGLGRWVEEGIDHLGMWRTVEVTAVQKIPS
jgi:predicted GNAT family N-acyltransferase